MLSLVNIDCLLILSSPTNMKRLISMTFIYSVLTHQLHHRLGEGGPPLYRELDRVVAEW